MDEITHLIVEKLLLTPTEQLKSAGDSETVGAYAEALSRLFGLNGDAASAPQPQAENKSEPFAPRNRSQR